ncbi:hypothetical protein SOVF_108130 [Spinacia oleracea]|nr:hypothetical protein SOVF_108130 [Spinacia oleracea]
MHIPTNIGEDRRTWMRSESGEATAKSVYDYIQGLKAEHGSVDQTHSFWKHLWGMQILPKWKVFLWKVCNRALALNINLCKRGIQVERRCHLCGMADEDERHLFRDCMIAKHVWRAGDLGLVLEEVESLDIQTWIKNYFHYLWKEEGPDSPRAICMVITLWSIWLHRNAVVFKSNTTNPASIMGIIHQMKKDNDLGSNIRCELAKLARAKKQDHPNPVALIKGVFNYTGTRLMVDGAWKKKKNGDSVAAIGWVINHDQNVIAKGGGRIRAVSGLQAEGYAILRGLKEANKCGCRQITTLSDSRTICKLLQEGKDGPIEIASILSEIIAFAGSFDFCSIVNVSRDRVRPAHDLAYIARKHGMVD